MARTIPPREALWFGLSLIGYVSGILLATALLGLAVDALLGTTPLGLAAGVFAGSVGATILTFRKVTRKLH